MMQPLFRNLFLFILCVPVLLLCLTAPVHAETRTYKRTLEKYTIPDVTLINQEGKRVQLKNILKANKPVVLDFIFATCTTICPVLSAGYVGLQQKLGVQAQNINLLSISIDPENDTPKIMKEYLKQYRAKPGWDFLTGSRNDINTVMKAFDAYIPNKMSHYPLTLIYSPQEKSWIRLYGIMSSSEFTAEAQKAGI